MHGMPRGRWPPLLFGIHTRRRGLGTYFPEVQPALKAIGVDPFERLAITPRRSRIRATTAIGFKQDVLATDLVPKGVEAEGWFSLSFRLQRGLQLLNRFRRRS